MSTLSQLNPTLADLASRLGPDQRIATVMEILNLANPIAEDATMIECNDGSNHTTTIRSGLPDVTWRVLNYGVQPSKSRTVKITDVTGMLESYIQVDKALAGLYGQKEAFLLSESLPFFEAMKQEMASTIFYGNVSTDPEKFTGLAPRYSSLSAANAENIINASGAGSDNTSIWLVVWGANTCHMIYPKGTMAGLIHEDLGEQTVTDTAGGLYQAYRSHFQWKAGLTLRDWQAVGRIANIDVSDLSDAGESGFDGANLPNLLIKLYNKVMKRFSYGRPVIYCNETIKTALDLLASNKSNTQFTVMDGIDGMPITRFRGIPIKQCDAILNTEEKVA